VTPSVSIVLPVLISHPWQRHLTEAAIKILRDTTQVPFELIVVETESKELEPESFKVAHDMDHMKYLYSPNRTTLAKDINAGIDAATGDFIGWTGNDIITKPGWLEALLECFDRYRDCGIASLAAQEVGAMLNHAPSDFITEGWYGPLVLFRKGWRLDEAYQSLASDNDLIMRLYQAGLRAYRNHKVVVLHLNTQTHDRDGAAYKKMEESAHALFVQKWGRSPLWPATMILRGGIAFGREFERG